MGAARVVAVVGPSTVIGADILGLLHARAFPTSELRLLDTGKRAGEKVEHAGRPVTVRPVGADAFEGVEIALFAAGPTVAGAHAPVAAESGAVVVDTSSRFRLDPRVPLVVPEVNREAVGEHRETGIVACPSAAAVALTAALAPLAVAAGLRRVVVSTYQGTATGGRRRLEKLARESAAILRGEGTKGKHRAFDCRPQIGRIEEDGVTTRERGLAEETRRVLGVPDLPISVTAVRVPIFFGQALSVIVETERPLGAVAAGAVLREAPGILLHDPSARPPTPRGVTASEATHIGRLRDDPAVENGLALWIALDGVRKGAALTAVGIAEILVRDHL